jgi:hypothetical protein
VEVVTARGTPEINLVGANLTECKEHQNSERAGHEHCPRQLKICDDGHRQRSRDAAGGREALVLSELVSQFRVADQPKGKSNNAAPEDSPSAPLQHFRHNNWQKAGPKVKDEDARGDSHYTYRNKQSFCSDGVESLAAGHLTDQTSDATYAEDKPNVLGRPTLRC